MYQRSLQSTDLTSDEIPWSIFWGSLYYIVLENQQTTWTTKQKHKRTILQQLLYFFNPIMQMQLIIIHQLNSLSFINTLFIFSYPSEEETFKTIIFQESKHLVITSYYFVFSSHPRMIYRRSFKSRDGTSGNMTWTAVLS